MHHGAALANVASQIPKAYGRQETAGKTLDFGILDGPKKILFYMACKKFYHNRNENYLNTYLEFKTTENMFSPMAKMGI